MNQSLQMCCLESVGNHLPQSTDGLEFEWTIFVEYLLQCFAVNVFHHQKGEGSFLDRIDIDDIFMTNRRGGPGFAQKPLAGRGSGSHGRRHDLDGNNPVQSLVERLKHDPAAAPTDQFLDIVMAEAPQRTFNCRRFQKTQIQVAFERTVLDRCNPRHIACFSDLVHGGNSQEFSRARVFFK